MNDSDMQIKLCKFLLQKYSDIINEREQRTIGEIKALTDGTDLTIQNITEEFKGNQYTFEDNYLETLKKIYDYIKKEVDFIDVNFGINYWLTAKEIINLKISDDEDLAVLTCAFMKALGDNNAEVIIAELDNLKTHAFVVTTINENFLILDPAQKKEFETFFGKKTEIIREYTFNKQKIKKFLYRFNSEKYEQFLD
ncbi:MAG: transglutaminase-like domain-containing protein [Candidatus ainarchaeum sp.]|nr:transglutaminase-like domain-containing protein [Candidatus ainarchaeum sp.]